VLTFASPSLLWLGLALIPVVALYLLRRRFRRRPSGSNYLWNRVAGRAPGSSRPELRSLLLLALQVGAALCAVLAAAGPAIARRGAAEPGLAILVDVSASMATADMADAAGRLESRVAAAAQAALGLVEGLAPGRPLAVFACSSGLRPLAEPGAGRGQAAASLGDLFATDSGFRELPVAEAFSAWLSSHGGAWESVLFTDGGLDAGGERLAAAAGSLRIETLGGAGRGGGVADLRITDVGGSGRSAAAAGARTGTTKRLASFRAFNGGGAALAGTARLKRDGDLLAEAALVLEPGWSTGELAFQAGSLDGGYELSLVSDGETFGRAWLSVHASPPRRVLLVGRDDPYLRAALAYPGIELFSSAEFPGPKVLSTLDLVVAEGVRAPAGLACPLLSIAALPTADGRGRGSGPAPGPLASGALATVAGNHPLARFVSWEGARAEESLSVLAAPGTSALATAGGKVVAAAWMEEGFPRAFIGFDPARSDFGLSPSWPIFVANLLGWCAPREGQQSAYSLVAGGVAQRALPDGFRLQGRGAPAVTRRGRLSLLEAGQAGLYRWSAAGDSGWLAVNPPAEELDASPRVLAAPARRPLPLVSSGPQRRDLTFLPLAGLLAFLVAEWLVWRGLPPWLAGRRRDARR
jgi:hypothetical protein